jgi:hypothetical protein
MSITDPSREIWFSFAIIELRTLVFFFTTFRSTTLGIIIIIATKYVLLSKIIRLYVIRRSIELKPAKVIVSCVIRFIPHCRFSKKVCSVNPRSAVLVLFR